jgi:hypothetical protein
MCTDCLQLSQGVGDLRLEVVQVHCPTLFRQESDAGHLCDQYLHLGEQLRRAAGKRIQQGLQLRLWKRSDMYNKKKKKVKAG